MKLNDFSTKQIWFVTGSQHLYGEEALKQVAANSQQVAEALNASPHIPVEVVYKRIGETPDVITQLCRDANFDNNCIGLIFWCHTFSPAKMWIRGLSELTKPFAHLHTQFYRDIPWSTIDMDYMNLHQAAHGDREFGFIHARMRLDRKVVVGHWEDPEVHEELGTWTRAALAWNVLQGAKFCRFGDNMREVAVTEGDKVAAQARFGYSVNGFGIGELVAVVDAVEDSAIDALCAEYESLYTVDADLRKGGARHESLRYGARQEIGIERILEQGGFQGFTTTFENLVGLKQLPGLAVQRLMSRGYGFGAEGDWKSAALLRAMKVMGTGLKGGTSFMEDYTYHLHPEGHLVLGSHMLEICESIAADKPTLEIHPLGIGGKEDPVRLVFDTAAGSAVNATIVDLGNRFRLVVNDVEVVDTPEKLEKLPVARALWKPAPDFKTSAHAWILAGGSHHPIFSQAYDARVLKDFANIAGIECAHIDKETSISRFQQDLRNNEVFYQMNRGFSQGG